MKYKILTFFLIFFLVIGCLFLNAYYQKDLLFVYHQHLEDNSDESKCLGIDDCTHLPIVSINTNNQAIPGEDHSKVNYIIADVNIYDGGNDVSRLGVDGTSLKTRLRYRGRSSLEFDKKGYLLKFVDENDKKIDHSFLGMPSDNQWALHGPFIDKSLIRNYMWYNIGQEIMGGASKVRFFEFYLDDEYQGLYLAVESVTQSESSRAKMESINKDSFATSYLLQLDTDTGNETTYVNSFSKYAYKINNPIYLTIKYPEQSELTADVKDYIYDDFANFEKMLYSFDYKDYKQYIDVDSFVDYFIINEFTQNYDAGYLSTYIYKDIFGKYKMYLWDFNSANNNYEDNLLIGDQWFEFQNNLWYEQLIKDPDFVEAIISRYHELRKSYLSDEYLFNYIDETVSYLGDAVDRNFLVWGYTLEPGYNDFTTNFMPGTHEEAIMQLKQSIEKRGKWMDENIEVLRHYSHESKNKKFNK